MKSILASTAAGSLFAVFAFAQPQVKELKVTVLSTMLADAEGFGEWGFAGLVQADGHQILVDTGAHSRTVLENVRALRIDLSQVGDVVLTHFHNDHVGGLMTLRTEMKKRNPVALSRVHFATGMFYSRPQAGGGEINTMIAMKPKFEATAGQFIEHDSFTEILPGVFLTGPIPRRLPERNFAGGSKVRTPLGVVEDNVPEDQSLVVNTNDGLVVITGCGHAGIANILTEISHHFDRRPVLAVVGGLHLYTASDEQVDWTADRMKSFGVRYLVGAHCTGIEALYRLRSRIGLTRQTAVVGAVGTDFTLKKGIHPGQIAR